jgi:putative protease
MGVERVILSRELSLDEVAEIRQACPEMEIEVFVHGALCIAYSGRCLLSGYFNHRDPNQGTCTNACRWKYELSSDDAPLSACGGQPRHPAADGEYLLREPSRPDELMPILEDEHGTYIMNSRDLRAIEHVERLVKIGVDSLKIEGRTKSHYYVGRTTQLYKQAINDAVAGKPFDWSLMRKLDSLANRGYTDGFYQRRDTAAHQNYEQGASLLFNQRFVGELIAYDEATGLAEFDVKNKFCVGDSVELIDPKGNETFTIASMIDARKNKATDMAPGSGHRVKIPVPYKPSPEALLAVNVKQESRAE